MYERFLSQFHTVAIPLLVLSKVEQILGPHSGDLLLVVVVFTCSSGVVGLGKLLASFNFVFVDGSSLVKNVPTDSRLTRSLRPNEYEIARSVVVLILGNIGLLHFNVLVIEQVVSQIDD